MRATHCKRGHDLADAYVTPDGKRQCRVCAKLRACGVAPPIPQPYGPSKDRAAYQRTYHAAHRETLAAKARDRYRAGVRLVRGAA